MRTKLTMAALPVLAVMAVLAACSDDEETDLASGDAGTDAADATSSDDGASDSGTPGDDAGESDAATEVDAGDDAAGGDPRLVVHYAFEENATTVADTSGQGHDAVLSDVAAWTASGRVGRGVALATANPATQFISLPDGLLAGVDDFTIAAWVNLKSEQNWARIYDIGNGKADPDNRFMFLTPNGFAGAGNAIQGLHATSYGGAAANEIISTTGVHLPLGVWKHVAITGSGGNRTMYIDGFPAGNVTGGPTVNPKEMEPLGAQSWIGKSRFPDPGLDGSLDEFRIYKAVLTDAEIADLAWPKLDYANWRFDEGAGATTKESSDHALPTVFEGDVKWTAGRLGNAADLTGGATNPHVRVGAAPLAACTTELTVAAWFKLHGAPAPWSKIFDFSTSVGGNPERFINLTPTDGAGVHFAMVSPNGVFDLIGPSSLPSDDAWHHVAVTVAADKNAVIYVDGVSVASKQNTTDVKPGDFAATPDNYFGRSTFAADAYLNGALDDVRVACRAYTASEVRGLAFK